MQQSLYFKNALVLYPDFSIKRQDVGIKDSKLYLKDLDKQNTYDSIFDASNFLIMPGLANMHNHLAMSLLRGLAENKTLKQWLETEVWPREKQFKPEHIKIASLMSIAEMFRNGITLSADMYFYEEQTAQAFLQANMRALIGYGMIDIQGPDKTEYEKKQTLKFLDFIQKQNSPLLIPVISPHSPHTCSKELLTWSKDIAIKHNLALQIHVSETRKEVYSLLEKTSKRPVEYLNSIDFFSAPRIYLNHCVYVSKREIDLINSNKNIYVVNNPSSNMKLAGGAIAPIFEFYHFGAQNNLLLGTDGPASNNAQDIFSEMKFSSLLQKNLMWDASIMQPSLMLKMASFNAYSSLGLSQMQHLGIADIILIDLNNPIFAGYKTNKQRILSALVFSANPSIVYATIVNGKIVYINGEYKTLDYENIQKQFDKVCQDLGI